MPDSISDRISTTGRVTVGSSVTGEIETPNDRDAYAVELVAGRTYRIDLEGVVTDKGTLADPFLRWLRDETGTGLVGTRDDNGGAGANARQTFTPEASGTYYISARGKGDGVGTYTVTVTDTTPQAPVFGASAYAFDLAENADGSTTRVSLGTVAATNPEGATLAYSLVGDSGSFDIDGASGELFYAGAGEDFEAGTTQFTLTVRASDGTETTDTTVTVNVTDVNETPTFAQPGYTFDLAENTDGSTTRVSLGTVAATDPEGATLAYSLVGDSGSFDIDGASGELFYAGSGEDFEAGTTQFTLTVRASDGTETTDTTVTVNVTDVNETPTFAQPGYTFDLAENTDGSTTRVSLGTVAATDPEGATLAFSLVGDSGSFEIDEASGELFYAGSGEDHESGTTSFTLTVRASDESETTDTTVTVNVTDVNETPTFADASYTFDLAENTDGSTDRVSLGTVAATDPEGTALVYSLIGGSESGSFEIDAATGELFYAGSGEDFESGATRFTLTVRASDGSETADTTITVNVTDVEEAVDPPVSQPQEAAPQTVSEPDDEDFSKDTSTSGQVVVGETATGAIGSGGDRDWFAVKLVEGRSYTIDLRGSPTGDGTLSDTYLHGIYDAEGNLIARTTNDDWGGTYNSQVTFTATKTGTHYIGAGAFGTNQGTYEVAVTDNSAADDTRAGATDLGDITALQGPRFPQGTVDGADDGVDYYRFTLTEAKRVGLGLRQQDADADLFLEDANGTVLYRSTNAGTTNEKIEETLLAGTYYVRVEAQAAGVNAHVVRYGVSAPDPDAVAALQAQAGTGTNAAPAFGQQGYTFALAENADGSTTRVSLGTVAATDPEGTTLAYGLVGDSGSFAIDEASGELFYTGAGEDFESDATSYDLTVRASDGSLHADTTVTVNVTNVNETPAFTDASYTFALAENADGSTNRISLGTVAATDPEGTTLAYSLIGGNESGSFEIDETSGELFYNGSGEDFESDTTQFTLTVRASDGSETADTTVTINVTDVDETPAIRVADAEATEGDDTAMLFRVTLESASSATVTVNYATADGTAVAGEDYTATSGTLTFAPGETEKTVSVAITDDTVEDSGETFRLVLSDPSGATLADSDAVGTILNTETSVSEPGGEDLPTDVSTAGVVAVGGSAKGKIGVAGDQDWFAVTLEAGTTYRIDLKGFFTGGGRLLDPYLRGIYDSSGTLISGTANDNVNPWYDSRVWFTPTENGIHYIAAGAASHYTGTYTLSVTEPNADDFSADASTTGEVTVGGSVDGEVETAGDRDWFAVEVVAGTTYRVDLERTNPSLTWFVNLAVHDEDGNPISGTTNYGSGLDSRLYFTATDTGTHYISAGGSGDLTGSYKLRVTESNADEYTADTSTMGRATVGDSVDGEIAEPGDVDWFAVDLVAGRAYKIDLEATWSAPGQILDTALKGIHDGDGDLIPGTEADGGGSGLNSRLYFTATETGTHYIAAGATTNNNFHVGTYQLSVEDLGLDDGYSADTSTSGQVAVNGTASGNITEPWGCDWFAVEFVADTAYRIDLKGSPTGDGTLTNPYLRGVYDAEGSIVPDSVNNDGGVGNNARLSFTASETGTYYIAAGTSYDTGTYELSVDEVM